jgi:F-type H+-transporting ATPase subunit a
MNWYASFLHAVHAPEWLQPIASSLFATLLLLLGGLYFRTATARRLASGEVAPDGSFSFYLALESIVKMLAHIADEQCGKKAKTFLPFFVTLFLTIFISNLVGLVPGMPPWTENLSANLALGLVVFLVYNAAGVVEHGPSYLKQFAGPFMALAPLFVVLESISHLARPFSLSFRLTANIFGDHLLLGIFSGLAPYVIPSFLMFFGLLVAVIQSFVFTMLTGIYINMAISHDH